MRFMTVWTPNEPSPPTPELMADMGVYMEEVATAGVLVDGGAWLPVTQGARLTSSGGKVTVIDGPFTEAKEVIAGWAIIDVPSKEEAIRWSTRFVELHAKHGIDGTSEVRPFVEEGDFDPNAGAAQG